VVLTWLSTDLGTVAYCSALVALIVSIYWAVRYVTLTRTTADAAERTEAAANAAPLEYRSTVTPKLPATP